MAHSFFSLIFRQKYIKRWGLMRNVNSESLSEHSFECAILAHCLSVIGNTYFGKEYDTEKAALLALYHDVTEVYTGDLPTPVKYFSPEMRAEYAKIEENAANVLLSKLPPEMKGSFEELLIPKEEDLELTKIVKAADKLCAYIKCITEADAGNNEFSLAKLSTEKALKALGSPEVDFFIENMLDAFTVTIDEM